MGCLRWSVIVLLAGWGVDGWAKACLPSAAPHKSIKTREEVFAQVPFKKGERSVFDVDYMSIHAGTAQLEVAEPVYYGGVWYRVFNAWAKTGAWYKAVFVASDFARAHSRAEDFAARWFQLSVDEGRLIGARYTHNKVLEFAPEKCQVTETSKTNEAPAQMVVNELAYGSADTLGLIFAVRAQELRVGQMVRVPTYSSGQSWTLEAMPEALEQVQVPAGSFKAMRLALKTMVGKALTQSGKVFVWIGTEHPARPLVRMSGEVKVGHLNARLASFTPGN